MTQKNKKTKDKIKPNEIRLKNGLVIQHVDIKEGSRLRGNHPQMIRYYP